MNYRIDELRGEMTMQQLADRINCSREYLQAIKSNKRSPSQAFLRKTAVALGVEVRDLYVSSKQDQITMFEQSQSVPPPVTKNQAAQAMKVAESFIKSLQTNHEVNNESKTFFIILVNECLRTGGILSPLIIKAFAIQAGVIES